MARHVAFLRGINLGATRRVPMKDLRAALEQAGYTHAVSYTHLTLPTTPYV